MPTGKIKFYSTDKGYGFIAQDSGEDIFFHHSTLQSTEQIRVGQRVKYETTPGKRGLEARNIQILLTPFEAQRSQSKVVAPKLDIKRKPRTTRKTGGTLVWTPEVDIRKRPTKPPTKKQATTATTERSDSAKETPRRKKPISKPTKTLEQIKKRAETPEVIKKPEPVKKPEVAKAPQELESKEVVEPTVEVKAEMPPESDQKKISEEKRLKRIRRNKKLSIRREGYGRYYILKQVKQRTPMIFEVYNHEPIPGTIRRVDKFSIDLNVDEKVRNVLKHDIKYCYKQEDADKVKVAVTSDESIRAQGLTPVIPRKERYHVDDDVLKETKEEKKPVRILMREGEIISGIIEWFSFYDIKVCLLKGGKVVVFRHAIYDFKVLDDIPATESPNERIPEAATEEEKPIEDSTATLPLNKKILAARTALGMSLQQVADVVGVSAATIGNWEKGRSTPRQKNLEEIEKIIAKVN